MLRNILKRALGPRLANARAILGSPLAYTPGHFYSPICNPAEIEPLFGNPRPLEVDVKFPGIDLRLIAQRELWQGWADYLRQSSFLTDERDRIRYRAPNPHFGVGEAVIYSCFLRQLRPRRVIEIGSGYSSAVALDTIDMWLDGEVACTFIEPHPALLQSLLKSRDAEKIQIVPCKVQEVDPKLFESLERNDILFIDSTHMLKTCSDVVHELFQILPRLKPGVLVHFHDVHYPFEYPKEWVIERNYSWNEVYALRAFLMYNLAFEVSGSRTRISLRSWPRATPAHHCRL